MLKYEFSIGMEAGVCGLTPKDYMLEKIHSVASEFGIDCYTISFEWGSWKGSLEQSARLWLIDNGLKLDIAKAKQLAMRLKEVMYQECVLLQVSKVDVYFV